jgi:hypothetical protein
MPDAASSEMPVPVSEAAGCPGLQPPEFNPTVAHPARVYDYWLGGKDHFAADRALGDAITAIVPSTLIGARANRAFLSRAVRSLVREAGIRQFLDIGTGIPTAGNVHEVAQSVAPESRVLYVDKDGVVLAHARALMRSHPAGATAFIQADLREPDRILTDPALRATLDLGQPVALMLIAILHFLSDADDPHRIVAELVDALPSGSYLTISHLTPDFDPKEAAAAKAAEEGSGVEYVLRSHAEVTAFFAGLDLVDPGVVPLLAWRPDNGTPQDLRAVRLYAAMGRKP